MLSYAHHCSGRVECMTPSVPDTMSAQTAVKMALILQLLAVRKNNINNQLTTSSSVPTTIQEIKTLCSSSYTVFSITRLQGFPIQFVVSRPVTNRTFKPNFCHTNRNHICIVWPVFYSHIFNFCITSEFT